MHLHPSLFTEKTTRNIETFHVKLIDPYEFNQIQIYKILHTIYYKIEITYSLKKTSE